MKKSTKGAVAAAAAGALLLGGAGSLAYWTDGDTITGGTFNSGTLSLTAVTSGAADCTTWKLDTVLAGGQPFAPATDLLVPGDVLKKLCAFTIDATGTHLKATVDAVAGTNTGDLIGDLTIAADDLKVGTSFANATTVTEITEADDAKKLYLEVSVTLPYGDAGTVGVGGISTNETQNVEAVLGDIEIKTTQVHTP